MKGTFNIDGHKITVISELQDYAWCCSNVEIVVDGVYHDMGQCLISGGSVWFDEDWGDHVESGPWDIKEWGDIPEELQLYIKEAINQILPHGCCGGCV